jgi:molybdopterin converting factor subunit 1
MRITVLFFANLRDLVGHDRTSLDLRDGSSVQQALDELFRAYPMIEPWRGRIAVAMNERYVPLTARLSDGCTLGVIPPVSGG